MPASGDTFGADLFVVGTNDSNDTIYDFCKHGDLDLIDLKAMALTWSDLLARSSLTVGQGFVIQLGPSANPSVQSLTIVDTGATAGATI